MTAGKVDRTELRFTFDYIWDTSNPRERMKISVLNKH